MYGCQKTLRAPKFIRHQVLWISAFLFFVFMFLGNMVAAQENNPYIAYNVPAQNSLKFNRFLINPTFSTVREDKSYLNMFHRNQSAFFEDNLQSYFLSYSGKMT
ncbi:MAG TPA: type IX secretion system membrane protein PorP/SprF, partial [Arenibacter sp.]|nr:type IX secretion system membrane protein PorP/SprF [Arenibacter sp.]